MDTTTNGYSVAPGQVPYLRDSRNPQPAYFSGQPNGSLTFGAALEALKKGARIARSGWNGKGMWLAMSGRLQGTPVEASQFWSHHNRDFAATQESGHALVLPSITMKTADGTILMGWLASQSDMFAEDWAVL